MVVFLLAVVSWVQAGLPDHLLRLARIKHQMADNLRRAPNYVCLATIERHRKSGPRASFLHTDTVRLEVAEVGDKELFAWPGESRLDERDLAQMVGGGMVATGEYASHAKSVFESNAPTFSYVGEEELAGRRSFHYQYRISEWMSQFSIKVGGQQAVVAYHGSFWADAGTLELLRLTIEAENIAPELRLSSSRITLDYAKVRIGASDFLLPQRAELVMEQLSGETSRNLTQFSQCRQYQAESVLKFDLPAETPQPQPVAEIVLPTGLRLDLRLETALDSRQAVVGDTLIARLVKDLKQAGDVIVPAGATAHGRIRRLDRQRGYYAVGLEFYELEFGQVRARFTARLEKIPTVLPGASAGPAARIPRPPEIVNDRAGVGTFFVNSGRFNIPHLEMVWRTQVFP